MEQSDIDLLQSAPLYHIQAVIRARHIPIPLKGTTTDTTTNTTATTSNINILEVARYLFDDNAISAVLQELGEVETIILWELTSCGGRANSRDLALYLTNAGLFSSAPPTTSSGTRPDGEHPPAHSLGTLPPQYPVAHPHGLFEQALRHLLVLGLLFWGRQTNFAGRDYTSGIHDGVLIVPLAVRDVIATTVHLEEDVPAHSGEIADDVGESARNFQRQLYLYWSMVASLREGLTLLSNGLLTRSSLRIVVEQMSEWASNEAVRTETDIPRLLFIRLLLMKLGLLRERRGAVLAQPADAYFARPMKERMHQCFQLYLEQPLWNEMAFLPDVNVRPGPGPLESAHEEVVHARKIVAERLLHEHSGRWRDFPAFIARTKLYAPYLLFPRQYGYRAERYSANSNPYGWDFRLRRGWLTHREGWHMVEGGFIRAVVSGPLHWLGLVEVEREEHPMAFCPLPTMTAITAFTPSNQEEIPWGRLIVQPNFELVALAPVSEYLLVQLDRFAERVSLEHIAQYRLTKASVTRAIQMGLRAEKIQQELEKAAGGEIPQNVRYSLIEWERQARRVELWQGATLLEVDDPMLLDTLFADEQTRELFGRRLAPTMAEVPTQHLSEVQHVLWQHDYLPALTASPAPDFLAEDGTMLPREPQWQLQEDGTLLPRYAVTDLYMAAEIARFSEHDATTGHYRITPASLQQAREKNINLHAIMRFLQHYCEGGIPPSFIIRLKLWGEGYGQQPSILVEHAPLLRLPPAILRDIQADAELNRLLGSEVTQPASLVHIDPQHLEQVLALLRERGFTVE